MNRRTFFKKYHRTHALAVACLMAFIGNLGAHLIFGMDPRDGLAFMDVLFVGGWTLFVHWSLEKPFESGDQP